jgi:hypothetical protein
MCVGGEQLAILLFKLTPARQIEETLPETGSTCYFQAALLYTSSAGDRRIRVHTLALPTTMDPAAVFLGADPQALACLFAKMGAFGGGGVGLCVH